MNLSWSSEVYSYMTVWPPRLLVPAVDKQGHTVHMEACKPSYNLHTMGRRRTIDPLRRGSSREATWWGKRNHCVSKLKHVRIMPLYNTYWSPSMHLWRNQIYMTSFIHIAIYQNGKVSAITINSYKSEVTPIQEQWK